MSTRGGWLSPGKTREVEARVEVVEFDPFGGSFLEDPYPHFARHLRDQPVFYAEDLGYWVISRYGDCRRVAARVRDVLRQQRPCPGDDAVSGCSCGARRRRVPLDPDDHQRGSAGAHAHAPHRPGCVHAAAGRPDGTRRASARARLPRSAPARRSIRHRRRVDVGAAGARPVPHPRRAGVGHHRGQGRRQDPAELHVRPRQRRRAGVDRRWAWPGSGGTARNSPTIGVPDRATTSRLTWCTPPTRLVTRSASRRWRRSCSGCCSPATRRRRTCSATACAGSSSSVNAGRRCVPSRR